MLNVSGLGRGFLRGPRWRELRMRLWGNSGQSRRGANTCAIN